MGAPTPVRRKRRPDRGGQMALQWDHSDMRMQT